MNENAMSALALRIQAAAPILERTPEELEALLKSMGVTSVEMIDDDDVFKFGDFRTVLNTTPIATLRLAFKHLRGGRSAEAPKDDLVPDVSARTKQLRLMGFKSKLEDMDTADLLKAYLPDKPTDPVTLALKARFDTKPVIAFKDDGTVALEESLRYIADLEQGFPEAETIHVDSKLSRLYAIGAKPTIMVPEDPLFVGAPLRNDCSTVNNRNWKSVNTCARQLCRIIAQRGDVDVNNKEAVLRLLERASIYEGQAGMPLALTEAYPEAYLEYNELAKRNELPKLLAPLGATKQNNPFGSRRRY